MKDAKELAVLNRKLTNLMEQCNDISMQIFLDLQNNKSKRGFLTKAFLGQNGDNCEEFKKLSKEIRQCKTSEAGTIANFQESINNLTSIVDFFQKVFKQD